MESLIFSYVDKKELSQALKAFHHCTNLYTQLINESGRVILAFGEFFNYCKEFRKYLPEGESCAGEHYNASKRAVEFGDSYIFCCHSGLYHIVFPIITKSTMLGSVIVGPFLMDAPDSDMILDLTKKYDIPSSAMLHMLDYAHQLEVVLPEKVNEISRLLNFLMNSMISGSREVQHHNHQRLLQQSRINESIQKYKISGVNAQSNYPLDKEKLLIEKVKSGNITEANEIFNDLLAYLMVYDNHSIDNIKIRILELCTLLSRAAIEKGAQADEVLALNNKLMRELISCVNIDDIAYIFHENMEIFTDSLFYRSEEDSDIIRAATEYVTLYYAENVTLHKMSHQIGVNPSYLSVLFKQVTGYNFSEYLNKIRIEEAKRLLSDTDYPILDISVACGFNDQSYFTKVFRKWTGVTPKKFRKG